MIPAMMTPTLGGLGGGGGSIAIGNGLNEGPPVSVKPDVTTGVLVVPVTVGTNGTGVGVDNDTVKFTGSNRIYVNKLQAVYDQVNTFAAGTANFKDCDTAVKAVSVDDTPRTNYTTGLGVYVDSSGAYGVGGGSLPSPTTVTEFAALGYIPIINSTTKDPIDDGSGNQVYGVLFYNTDDSKFYVRYFSDVNAVQTAYTFSATNIDFKFIEIYSFSTLPSTAMLGLPGAFADVTQIPPITGSGGFVQKSLAGALSVIKNNLSATVAPVVGNDNTESYAIGSLWIDITADKIYQAVDVTTGAAVWKDLTPTVGASVYTPVGTGQTYTTVKAAYDAGIRLMDLVSDVTETAGTTFAATVHIRGNDKIWDTATFTGTINGAVRVSNGTLKATGLGATRQFLWSSGYLYLDNCTYDATSWTHADSRLMENTGAILIAQNLIYLAKNVNSTYGLLGPGTSPSMYLSGYTKVVGGGSSCQKPLSGGGFSRLFADFVHFTGASSTFALDGTLHIFANGGSSVSRFEAIYQAVIIVQDAAVIGILVGNTTTSLTVNSSGKLTLNSTAENTLGTVTFGNSATANIRNSNITTLLAASTGKITLENCNITTATAVALNTGGSMEKCTITNATTINGTNAKICNNIFSGTSATNASFSGYWYGNTETGAFTNNAGANAIFFNRFTSAMETSVGSGGEFSTLQAAIAASRYNLVIVSNLTLAAGVTLTNSVHTIITVLPNVIFDLATFQITTGNSASEFTLNSIGLTRNTSGASIPIIGSAGKVTMTGNITNLSVTNSREWVSSALNQNWRDFVLTAGNAIACGITIGSAVLLELSNGQIICSGTDCNNVINTGAGISRINNLYISGTCEDGQTLMFIGGKCVASNIQINITYTTTRPVCTFSSTILSGFININISKPIQFIFAASEYNSISDSNFFNCSIDDTTNPQYASFTNVQQIGTVNLTSSNCNFDNCSFIDTVSPGTNNTFDKCLFEAAVTVTLDRACTFTSCNFTSTFTNNDFFKTRVIGCLPRYFNNNNLVEYSNEATANATQEELFIDSSALVFPIYISSIIEGTITVSAVKTDFTLQAKWVIRFTVIRDGTTNIEILSDDITAAIPNYVSVGWVVTGPVIDVTATTTGLHILITGVAATDIEWGAKVEFYKKP